ncbi:hypothetical protein M3D60_004700 [Micrococcus luteus]|nr:hypothetical protein [Micrococcus luteus]MCV7569582.1 hypothetical protein [Micrococcus luteus]
MLEEPVNVAIVQAQSVAGDVDRNLHTLERTVKESVRRGADLVVTPELFATGYAPATAWQHDGQVIRAHLAELSARHGVGLVASTVDEADTRRHISASFFCPNDGEGTRVHKHHLFGDEERAHFHPGEGYAQPFQWRTLTWGMGICYDVEFPEFARYEARHGADVLLIPTAVPAVADQGPRTDSQQMSETSLRYSADLISTLQVPARALDNGVYVAYANHCGPGFTGRSCIATPVGRLTSLLDATEPGVAVAPVRTSAIRHARALNTYLNDLEG